MMNILLISLCCGAAEQLESSASRLSTRISTVRSSRQRRSAISEVDATIATQQEISLNNFAVTDSTPRETSELYSDSRWSKVLTEEFSAKN